MLAHDPFADIYRPIADIASRAHASLMTGDDAVVETVQALMLQAGGFFASGQTGRFDYAEYL